MQLQSDKAMVVIYDGDCPFCTNFVKLQNLRKNVGKVELVDARSGDPRVAEMQRLGHDLDEGMVVLYGEQIYYGSDAVALMSTLTGARWGVGRLTARLLRNKKRSAFLYPSMKFGRRIVLTLLGRAKIGDLGNSAVEKAR